MNVSQEAKTPTVRRLLFLQQRGWAVSIGRQLAKRFHRDGWSLAAITFKRSTERLVREQNEVPYHSILSHDDLFESSDDPNSVDIGEICEDLGVPSIWPLVRSMRNQVYSYGDKYYFSFRQNRTDEESLAYVRRAFVAFRNLFDDFQPHAIFGPNFVSLPQMMLWLMGKRRNCQMLALSGTKIANCHVINYSPFTDEGPLFELLRQEDDTGISQAAFARAQRWIEVERVRLNEPKLPAPPEKVGIGLTIRREIEPYVNIGRFLHHGRKDYVSNLGITVDYRPPRIILRDHYCAKAYKRVANSREYYSLRDDGKYAYYPLQVQPEAVIDQLSPEFSNQIEVARQVGMALPGDYTLLVKEHPTMVDKRPPSYHEKIARLPNVKLVDYRIPSERLLNQVDLIISPGGSTLVEAAMLCKPAIQLGRNGLTLNLPNVVRHTDMTTLSAQVQRMLSCPWDATAYEYALRRLFACIYQSGLPVNMRALLRGQALDQDYEDFYVLVSAAVLRACHYQSVQ